MNTDFDLPTKEEVSKDIEKSKAAFLASPVGALLRMVGPARVIDRVIGIAYSHGMADSVAIIEKHIKTPSSAEANTSKPSPDPIGNESTTYVKDEASPERPGYMDSTDPRMLGVLRRLRGGEWQPLSGGRGDFDLLAAVTAFNRGYIEDNMDNIGTDGETKLRITDKGRAFLAWVETAR